MKDKLNPSEFKNLKNIEYFDFEEDFMEENLRCIPMTIRYKMDMVGIKLKLAEWSKFHVDERVALATMTINTDDEKEVYNKYLSDLIEKRANNLASLIEVEEKYPWDNLDEIPSILLEQTKQHNLSISLEQWQHLTTLQRFALFKLCKSRHENKNFPIAMKEFGLA